MTQRIPNIVLRDGETGDIITEKFLQWIYLLENSGIGIQSNDLFWDSYNKEYVVKEVKFFFPMRIVVILQEK